LKDLLGELELNRIYQMDCLEGMSLIPEKSIDMILCDLPYGELECSWDSVLPLYEIWKHYERIIKDNGAIVLTATFKFAIKLYNSNPNLFKYELIWDKVKPSNIFVGKLRPLPKHEYIMIFSKGTVANKSKNNMVYYPIMEEQKERKSKIYSQSDAMYRESHIGYEGVRKEKYPKSILTFSNAKQKGKLHPTQKPVELFEYLIRTYTKEGEIVLDNCMGSGTTAVAATICNRKWIGFEIEQKYIEIANKRLKQLIHK
jgi:site-specific DNA-methyltransferase (adenine-specific)